MAKMARWSAIQAMEEEVVHLLHPAWRGYALVALVLMVIPAMLLVALVVMPASAPQVVVAALATMAVAVASGAAAVEDLLMPTLRLLHMFRSLAVAIRAQVRWSSQKF